MKVEKAAFRFVSHGANGNHSLSISGTPLFIYLSKTDAESKFGQSMIDIRIENSSCADIRLKGGIKVNLKGDTVPLSRSANTRRDDARTAGHSNHPNRGKCFLTIVIDSAAGATLSQRRGKKRQKFDTGKTLFYWLYFFPVKYPLGEKMCHRGRKRRRWR